MTLPDNQTGHVTLQPPGYNVVPFAEPKLSWLDRHVGLFYFLCALTGAALGIPVGIYAVAPLLEKLFG